MTTHQDNAPKADWSLDQLGEFCRERHQRMALDVWLIGKAMCLAKKRCQDEHSSFTEWKRRHSFSDATASRYMRLYMAYQSAEEQGRLLELGIMEALVEAGVVRPTVAKDQIIQWEDDDDPGNDLDEDEFGLDDERDDNSAIDDGCTEAELDEVDPNSPHRNVMPGGNFGLDNSLLDDSAKVPSDDDDDRQASQSPVWAVPDEDSYLTPPSDFAVMADIWSATLTLEDDCRKALPWQVRLLRQRTKSLLDNCEERLKDAWPREESERLRIIEDIDAVVDLLPRLRATVPQVEEELLVVAE